MLASVALAAPSTGQTDDPAVRSMGGGQYVVPRALVEDYVVCASEARALASADSLAVLVVASLEAEGAALRSSLGASVSAERACAEVVAAERVRTESLAAGWSVADRSARRSRRAASRWLALAGVGWSAAAALAGVVWLGR